MYSSLPAFRVNLSSMHQTIVLPDGSAVRLRPISPEDAEIEREFITGLSEQSRYLRIMGHVNELTEDILSRLTRIDFDREMALIALTDTPQGDKQIGVARFVTLEGGKSCEFAIVVADDWQSKGLGKQLMLFLIDEARGRGLEEMIGTTLPENKKMKNLASSLGFEIGTDPEDPRLVSLRLKL